MSEGHCAPARHLQRALRRAKPPCDRDARRWPGQHSHPHPDPASSGGEAVIDIAPPTASSSNPPPHAVEGARELVLGEIVLVLPRRRMDFGSIIDEFRKGIRQLRAIRTAPRSEIESGNSRLE